MNDRLTGVGGVWPATLTPFSDDGGIDAAAFMRHVDEIASTPGVRALVVNGHAGEATSLDLHERARIVAQANEAARGLPVVAGVLAEDTRAACAQARDAQRAGAAGLLLFAPALFAQGARGRPEVVREFVRRVAQASDLPIVLFQLSWASGLGYEAALLAELLAEVPQIVAIKEGSDVPERYEDTLRVAREAGRPVSVLSSCNTWLLGSLVYGGQGVLSGLGSVASPLLVELCEAMAQGELARARAVNERLLPLCRAFYRAPYFDCHNRMKTALHLLGKLPNAVPRAPLLAIGAAERERIAAALADAGFERVAG
ncbi:dihydrodipicolinate synthase family protein [Verticiella sediminum]|nr:dihydrodipicolinate synthase family protein [Verticiella sediminum]